MAGGGMNSIGATDDGQWLLGYDADGTPIVWQPGETPAPACELAAYGGWHLHRHGFDVAWCDPRGRLRRADGSIEN